MAETSESAKKALQRHVRKHLNDSEYKSFFGEIAQSKADALIAIRISALIEETLEQTIKASLTHATAEVEDQLFGQRGYLRDFAAKAVMAFAAGIIDAATYKNLNTIRAIRNAFAHSARELTFQDSRIHALCAQLEIAGFMDDEFLNSPYGEVRYYVAGTGAVEALRIETTRLRKSAAAL